ncbi:hypothetical protein M3664_04595 [Paenibacillus lautus]|nr:hypothetical protein [Paenibacillus lautus]MCM3257060.1 hypothetical protein [Paenibacillus lautus]
MDWKLFDSNGEFIQEVNCQYDALDLAVLIEEATIIIVDFNKKEARVKK